MHASNLLKAVLKPCTLTTTSGKKQSLVTTAPQNESSTKGKLISSASEYYYSSPPGSAASVTAARQLSHSSSAPVKMTCLCSPTNHPGSFRCRLHRTEKQSTSKATASSSSSIAPVAADSYQDGYQAAAMMRASSGMHPLASHAGGGCRPSPPLAKSPPGRPSRLNRMVANAQSEADSSVAAPSINESCVRISSTFANNGRCFMRPLASIYMADNPREIYSEYCQSTSKKAMDVFDRNMTRMYL